MARNRSSTPRSSRRRLQALAEIGRLVTLGFDQEGILRHTTEVLARLLDCPYARLWRVSSSSGDLVLVAGAGALVAETQVGLRRPGGTTTLNAAVLAGGTIYQTTDVAADPRFFNRSIIEQLGLSTYVGVPLIVGEQRFGVLTLLFPGQRVIAGEDLELVQIVAAQSAAALAHATEYEASRRRARRLSELNAVSRWVLSSLDRDEILRRIVAASQRVLDVPYSRLWLLSDTSDDLLQVASTPEGPSSGPDRLAADASLFGSVARSQQPFRTNDVLAHPAFQNRAYAEQKGLRSCIAVPVLDGQRTLGVLALMGPAGHAFSDEDLELLQVLAGFSATVIANGSAHAAVAESAAQMQRLYGAIACGVLVTSSDGRVVDANSTAEHVFGLTLEQMLGRPVAECWSLSGEDGKPLATGERPGPRALVERREVRDLTVLLTRLDGGQRWLQVYSMPIFGPSGEPIQSVSTFVDITARKEAETALSHQALHDALTGLPNRLLLRHRLETAIAAHSRLGLPLALLVIDLDRFKEVNDTLGHQYGDLLLCEVGRALLAAVRAGDTVARLGGDEFAVLLPGADAHAAEQVARQILPMLNRPFVLHGYAVDVAASIGVSACPEQAPDPDQLLRCADVAMYVAKRAAEGVAIYTPGLDQHTPDRLAMLYELRVAIETDQLELHYQPKVRLSDGQLSSLEALVRWRRLRRNSLVLPDEFIALAEQTGLIRPLTRWVLRAALDQARVWQGTALAVPIAVNLSMKDLRDTSLPDGVAELLAERRLTPAMLNVEITESGLMADPGATMLALGRLRELGVRVSMDDFGTGYSSLAYLKQLPLDELKIDRSFVRNMANDGSDCAIVRLTIELAHSLGLGVVAEGVEDAETESMLARLGCDGAQGYHFAPPLAAAELVSWARGQEHPARAA